VAAQREGFEGVFKFDELTSTQAFKEVLAQMRIAHASFSRRQHCLDDTFTPFSNVHHLADSLQQKGYLSVWGDALLDRVASFVVWATCIRHTYFPTFF